MSSKSVWQAHYPIICVALFLILAPCIIFFLSKLPLVEKISPPFGKGHWLTYEDQVKQGKIKPPGKMYEVVITYNADEPTPIKITKIRTLNVYKTDVYAPDHNYRLELLDADNQMIAAQPFRFETSAIREWVNPATGEPEGRREIIKKSGRAVTVPWTENAAAVRVVDVQGRIYAQSEVKGSEELNNKPSFETLYGSDLVSQKLPETKTAFAPELAHAQTGDGKIDVVFISSDYTDFNEFRSDVAKISKGFLEYEPYKSRASQFAFHTVEHTDDANLSCTSEGKHDCKFVVGFPDQLVASKGLPADAIAFLINSKNTSGGSYFASEHYIFFGNWEAEALPPQGQIFAHEFSHAFASLMDEYETRLENGPIDNQVHSESGAGPGLPQGEGNCYAGTPPAKEWAGVVPQDQYGSVCTYPNWYAPSRDSIMRFGTCFNLVSQRIINKRMDAVVGAIPGGVKEFSCWPPPPLSAEQRSATIIASKITPSANPTKTQPTSTNPVPTFFCGGSTDSICPVPTDKVQPTLPGQNSPTQPVNTMPTSSVPTPSVVPCEPKEAALAHHREKKERGAVSKFMKQLIQMFMQLIIMLLNLFGGQIPTNPTPENPLDPISTPCP